MGSAASIPTKYLRGYCVSGETEHTLLVQFFTENTLAAAVYSRIEVLKFFFVTLKNENCYDFNYAANGCRERVLCEKVHYQSVLSFF